MDYSILLGAFVGSLLSYTPWAKQFSAYMWKGIQNAVIKATRNNQ
jgi:hypothetical protein